MQNNPMFNPNTAAKLAPDVLAQQMQLQMEMQNAQRLREEGGQPLQGQMVSGHYVPPSWTEALNRGLKTYLGGQALRDMPEKYAELARGQQAAKQAKFDAFAQAMGIGGGSSPQGAMPQQGQPPMQQGEGPQTFPVGAPQGLPQQPQPSAAPDRGRALLQAMMSGDPDLQKFAQSIMSKGMTSLTPGQVTVDALGNVANPRPMAGGEQGWKTVSIGGDLYQQTATGLKKLDNAPKVNVSVGGPNISMGKSQGKLAEALGKNAADDVADSVKAATTAQAALGTMGTLQKLNNTFSGPTAQPAVWLGQLASTIGMELSPDTRAKLTNSQTFNSAATELWLNVMNSVGGARGLTEPESNRIARALPSLLQTPEGREQMIKMYQDKANETINLAKVKQKAAMQAAQADDPTIYYQTLSEAGIPTSNYHAEPTMQPASTREAQKAPISLDDYLKSQGGQ